MANKSCKHGKRAPIETLRSLDESQAAEGRHKCATCAYMAGYQDGLEEAIVAIRGLRQSN